MKHVLILIAFLTTPLVRSVAGVTRPVRAEVFAFHRNQDSNTQERAIELLLGGEKEDEEDQQLAVELRALGSEALPVLFDMLDTGTIKSGESLGLHQRQALMKALESFPRTELLDSLKQRTHEGASEKLCIAALELLEVLGKQGDLDFAVELAEQQRDPLPGAVAFALQATTGSILRKYPRAIGSSRQRLVHSRVDVGFALVRGIGDSANPAAVELLTGVLGLSPELDLALIVQAGCCAQKSLLVVQPQACAEVRRYLLEEPTQLLRETAMALGRMRDSDALPELIDLLSHENRAVSDSAYWALRQITGMTLRQDQGCWKGWLAGEELWYEQRRPELLSILDSADEDLALVALNEIGRHRIAASDLVQEVESYLWVSDPATRRLACATLANLRSKAAVPALIGMLEDLDEEFAQQALEALQSITGLKMALDPEAWQAALAG